MKQFEFMGCSSMTLDNACMASDPVSTLVGGRENNVLMYSSNSLSCLFYCILHADTHIPQDPSSPPAHRKNAQIQNLEKQLAIEQRVKSGAETMITMYTNPKN